MFGSLLTRPYRLATRGAELAIRGTLHAIDLAGGAITAVATRVMGGSRNGHEPEMTPVTQTPPDPRTPQRRRTRATAATPTAAPDTPAAPTPTAAPDTPATPTPAAAPDTPSGPDAPPGHEARPSTEGPPAPEPSPAEPALDAEGPASTPEPPSAARRLAAETGDQPTSDSLSAEPAHVSEEPELVEEFAEPGAEEGAGAQLRIIEPWDGYNEMTAADIIERLGSASREELATVELYELAGRNRKSVVAAAQRALRQASPPR
jgi:hypothetical protein